MDTVLTQHSHLSVDGLRIKDGKVQLHFVGDRRWYTQVYSTVLMITVAKEKCHSA